MENLKDGDIFIIDEETSQFIKVKRNLWFYLRHYAFYILLAIITSIGLIIIYYQTFDTKEVKAIKEQNKKLAELTEYYAAQVDSMQLALDSLQKKDKELYRLILNAEPIEKADSNIQTQSPKAIANNSNLDELSKKLSSLDNKLSQSNKRSATLNDLASLTKSDLKKIPTMRPIATEVISGFGKRKNPITKLDKNHPGIDLKANIGTPVKATADGMVIMVDNRGSGIGNYISIQHGFGYVTTYACLSSFDVRMGSIVKRGQIIGKSGNSGLSKGPHLHYEIIKNGKQVDPVDYFTTDLSPKDLIEYKKKASQYNESMD